MCGTASRESTSLANANANATGAGSGTPAATSVRPVDAPLLPSPHAHPVAPQEDRVRAGSTPVSRVPEFKIKWSAMALPKCCTRASGRTRPHSDLPFFRVEGRRPNTRSSGAADHPTATRTPALSRPCGVARLTAAPSRRRARGWSAFRDGGRPAQPAAKAPGPSTTASTAESAALPMLLRTLMTKRNVRSSFGKRERPGIADAGRASEWIFERVSPSRRSRRSCGRSQNTKILFSARQRSFYYTTYSAVNSPVYEPGFAMDLRAIVTIQAFVSKLCTQSKRADLATASRFTAQAGPTLGRTSSRRQRSFSRGDVHFEPKPATFVRRTAADPPGIQPLTRGAVAAAPFVLACRDFSRAYQAKHFFNLTLTLRQSNFT